MDQGTLMHGDGAWLGRSAPLAQLLALLKARRVWGPASQEGRGRPGERSAGNSIRAGPAAMTERGHLQLPQRPAGKRLAAPAAPSAGAGPGCQAPPPTAPHIALGARGWRAHAQWRAERWRHLPRRG